MYFQGCFLAANRQLLLNELLLGRVHEEVSGTGAGPLVLSIRPCLEIGRVMEGIDVVFEVFNSLRLLLYGLEVFRPALNVRFINGEGPWLTPLSSDLIILIQVLLVLYSLTLLAGDDALRYYSRSRPLLILLIGDLEVFLSHHLQLLLG